MFKRVALFKGVPAIAALVHSGMLQLLSAAAGWDSGAGRCRVGRGNGSPQALALRPAGGPMGALAGRAAVSHFSASAGREQVPAETVCQCWEWGWCSTKPAAHASQHSTAQHSTAQHSTAKGRIGTDPVQRFRPWVLLQPSAAHTRGAPLGGGANTSAAEPAAAGGAGSASG